VKKELDCHNGFHPGRITSSTRTDGGVDKQCERAISGAPVFKEGEEKFLRFIKADVGTSKDRGDGAVLARRPPPVAPVKTQVMTRTKVRTASAKTPIRTPTR